MLVVGAVLVPRSGTPTVQAASSNRLAATPPPRHRAARESLAQGISSELLGNLADEDNANLLARTLDRYGSVL